MIRELQHTEFTERLSPIFECIERETGFVGRFNPNHFYPAWRRMMEIGVARTWETEGAVLGAFFTPELYSGKIQVHIMFWFALPSARGTGRPVELMEACVSAAREAGAFKISSSAHVKSSPARAEQSYKKLGFEFSESVHTKEL